MIDFNKYNIDVSSHSSGSGRIKTFCPQCHHQRSDRRDKSLSVDLATGLFKCHYCGWSGCADDHNEKLHGRMNRPEQVKRTPKQYRKPKPACSGPLSEKALSWFQSRGISKTTLDKCRVTQGEEWMPQKEGKANTVQFNYYLDGQLVNTKFRTGDKCFKLVSGARLLPWNIDSIKGKENCIITEGEMDALSFIEVGEESVVSVPNGANANLDYLDDFIEDYFDDKKRIYIASDTDAKGTMLRQELIRRLGAERCLVLDYGESCKDANELLQAKGKEALKAALKEAQEVKVEGVFYLHDFEDELDAIYEEGLKPGLTLGMGHLDKLISFEPKRLCIVTGYPGSGKSEFIDQIAECLNIRYDWKFAFFSPENAPMAYHGSKLIEKFTGKRFRRKSLPMEEYTQVKRHLNENFFFIYPEDFHIDTILEKGRYLVRRFGIRCLVIDPYNRLDNDRGTQSETDYVSGFLDKLSAFAQQNDVLVILMAHPTKPSRTRDGAPAPPTLHDISGSAHFFNKADFGIVVHRDKVNETVCISIEKVKFRHLGKTGKVILKYNSTNGRYVTLKEDGEPLWDNRNHLVNKILTAKTPELPIDFTETALGAEKLEKPKEKDFESRPKRDESGPFGQDSADQSLFPTDTGMLPGDIGLPI